MTSSWRLYHDRKWQTPENIQERYDASIIPAAGKRYRRHGSEAGSSGSLDDG
jgi:hypothetical protein